MSDQQRSVPIQNMIIQLEIVPEDEQRGDIADADEVGRGIISHLRENGYIIRPAYTGRMGGPVFDIIVQTYQVIHDNQVVLAAFFASITAMLTLMSKRTKRSEKEKTQHLPTQIEITILTNDKNQPLIVKAPDVETAIAMLEHLKDTHPEEVKKAVPQINTKITLSVPKKKRYHAS